MVATLSLSACASSTAEPAVALDVEPPVAIAGPPPPAVQARRRAPRGRAPLANTRPVASAPATLSFSAPIARPSAPNVNDVSSLQRREDDLANQLGELNAERKMALRCANVLRRHGSNSSVESQERLERVFSRHAAEKRVSSALGRHSSPADFDNIEREIRRQADRVSEERKALIRLIIANKEVSRDPTPENRARLEKATQKYRKLGGN